MVGVVSSIPPAWTDWDCPGISVRLQGRRPFDTEAGKLVNRDVQHVENPVLICLGFQNIIAPTGWLEQ